jgi:hypothetical protein
VTITDKPPLCKAIPKTRWTSVSFYGSLKGESTPKNKNPEIKQMDDAKKQLIDKLKSSNNILVTVSRDPSVDQLASCIGLTLLLNKQGKHTAAVFSGKVPSTLEFLQPDETLEKNTDSLRDFIISLDKAKADKLRYKVEEDVVRIFITPYKTSLSQADLEFSEGDFNVDVVIALGVQQQQDLDQAITAHGRILHDATVVSITAGAQSELGAINWNDPEASSLSELVADLAQAVGGDLLDEQIATALMTGIVSETDRFSNDKTSSQTMSASAALMAAGANQQLVATQLESGDNTSSAGSLSLDDAAKEPGLLEIDHVDDDKKDEPPLVLPDAPAPEPQPEIQPPEFLAPTSTPPPPKPTANVELPVKPYGPAAPNNLSPGPKLVTEPPKLGGTLTANTQNEALDPVTDPLSVPQSEPPQLLDRKDNAAPAPQLTAAPTDWQPPAPAPSPPSPPPVIDDKPAANATLTDLEKSVNSPHVSGESLDTMRNEVDRALSGTGPADPIEALNAQPLGDDLHPNDMPPPLSPPADPVVPQPSEPSAPPAVPPAAPASSDGSNDDPNGPPPVPPPIPFQFGNSPPPQ